jgi:hypothetical protein
LLGGYFFSGKISKLFSTKFVKKNLLILIFIFIIRMFCKYFIFLGIINIFITIITICFLSLIILSLNYNNINNNLDSYLLKKIYIPLIIVIFIPSGIFLDVFIISFCILINIYSDYSFLLSTGNPGSSLPESSGGGSQGSGGVGGPGGPGGNIGYSLTGHVPDDEHVHGLKRSKNLKYLKLDERYNWFKEYYNRPENRPEYLDSFDYAFSKLRENPGALNYNDLAILKIGFVDYNYLLSPKVKENLHGLAKPDNFRKEKGYGLQTSYLLDNKKRKPMIDDAYTIYLRIKQENGIE